MKESVIELKVKICEYATPYAIGRTEEGFQLPREFQRHHVKVCGSALDPYINSNLLSAAIKGELRLKGIGKFGWERDFIFLERLPEGITVDRSNLLAKVTIKF